jgi:dephospho-CoA kinase
MGRGRPRKNKELIKTDNIEEVKKEDTVILSVGNIKDLRRQIRELK